MKVRMAVKARCFKCCAPVAKDTNEWTLAPSAELSIFLERNVVTTEFVRDASQISDEIFTRDLALRNEPGALKCRRPGAEALGYGTLPVLAVLLVARSRDGWRADDLCDSAEIFQQFFVADTLPSWLE